MRAIFAALLFVMAPQTGWAQTVDQTEFLWPENDPDVIPDARFSDVLRQARGDAESAIGRSKSAARLARSYRRRKGLRKAFGKSSKPLKIDAGTVLTGFPYNTESGPLMGVVTYPSGASMIGVLGPDMGIYTPEPESSISQFSGWVWGAGTSEPIPMEGVFTLKNGDTFVASFSGHSAFGIYKSSDGQRQFVGKFDIEHGSIQPEIGIVEDRKGRLLANLYPTD